ncbi:MAG: serine hydrolase [Acholeplasmataceae bacterium]|nr:serine hydrolase [Acholeplasmataceae bacterium]
MKNDFKYKALLNVLKEKKYSGIVSIEEGHQITFQYVSGMENRKLNIPITQDTLFAVASGTKFLTALAIGKLIDMKKMSLDSKAKELYDLKMDSIHPDITIKDLLSHTSGISDYLDEDLLDDQEPISFSVPYKDLINPKDFIPIFSKDPQKFIPGEKFNYNNQGYVYLGIIIEEVSKKSYKDFINDELLMPLGITRSGIYHLSQFPEHTALGYLGNEEDSLTNHDLLPYQAGGDGGAIISNSDMKKIWESFFNYQIISKELVEIFMHPHVVVDEKTNNFYGLGLWLKKANDGIYPYLFGGDPGISFTSSYNPNNGKYNFVASNTSSGVWDIFDELKKM